MHKGVSNSIYRKGVEWTGYDAQGIDDDDDDDDDRALAA